jgi:uncharacterized membrane protein
MKIDGQFSARVALFTALAYILALASVYIPNVSLSFIAIFACGALFGRNTGITTGGLSMFLWTVFNPFGMAPVPISIAQIIGMMIVGALGAGVHQSTAMKKVSPRGFVIFSALGIVSGLIYQILVSLVSAWLFGPFWASLSAGLVFMLATIISNGLIFPACYPAIVKLAARRRY